MNDGMDDAMNGRVTLAELIERGLSDHPANVVGVALPAIDTVICRSHADASTLHRLSTGDQRCPPTAILLIGGPDAQQALRAWCNTCRASTGKTTREAERPANAPVCAVCGQPINWTGVAWEHPTTGRWADMLVRHQASPVPKALPAPVPDRQDRTPTSGDPASGRRRSAASR